MRVTESAAVLAPLALDEAKAYLRISQDEDDALIAGLIRSAAWTCERFIGQALIVRETQETIPVSREWRRLTLTPVAAVTGVDGLGDGGEPVALAVEDYGIDIDGNGDGWVRITGPTAFGRVTVAYQAGMGGDWNAMPEALRQGIVRLTAHLFTYRDDPGDVRPPAAVAALWRPWRRMRLI